jgi:hypothetical protein
MAVITHNRHRLLSPAVSTAANPNGTDVSGTYTGGAATIEFFATPTGDPSGFGEGQFFIGPPSVSPVPVVSPRTWPR